MLDAGRLHRWLENLALANVQEFTLSDDARLWRGLAPYLYTLAIVQAPVLTYDIDRWCFDDPELARRCLAAWDGRGDPPDGWIKHVNTNRCRLNGDPTKETIGWPEPVLRSR